MGTPPGYDNAVSPHRVRAILACLDDDRLPEEPATIAAYELTREKTTSRAVPPATFPAGMASRAAASGADRKITRGKWARGEPQPATTSTPAIFTRGDHTPG